MGASLLHDWIDLQAKSSSYGGIVSYLQKEYPEAFESGMMFSKTKLKEDYRGISDIINGLSLGSISLGFGHSTRYWSKSGNTEIEAWAQFGRIYYKNDPKVRKMFSQLFPYFESDAIREVGRL